MIINQKIRVHSNVLGRVNNVRSTLDTALDARMHGSTLSSDSLTGVVTQRMDVGECLFAFIHHAPYSDSVSLAHFVAVHK